MCVSVRLAGLCLLAVFTFQCQAQDVFLQAKVSASHITVRPLTNQGLCLDLPGGDTGNGKDLWLWECNGHTQQMWLFEDYKLIYYANPRYCVDANGGGASLVLWECQDATSMTWGHDSNSNELYLDRSFAQAAGYNHLCMDLDQGKVQNGAEVMTWECNSCWNQQWWIGSSSMSQGALASPKVSAADWPWFGRLRKSASAALPATDSCPPEPSPGPSPGPAPPTPPASSSGQFCWDEQPGWPRFDSRAELSNDAAWSRYFELVYGELPGDGYPICVGSFRMLYSQLLQASGIQKQLGGRCASFAGEMFSFGQSLYKDGADVGGMSYGGVGIWHPNQNRVSLPSRTWVEITHSQTLEEDVGAWYYYMPGSGVWFNTGNTRAYNEHPEAARDFIGTDSGCSDYECDNEMSTTHQIACNSGVDSVQYIEHDEGDWKDCDTISGTRSLAIEIVDVCGAGKYSCGADVWGGEYWRAGWMASQACWCDESMGSYNCEGYVPNR